MENKKLNAKQKKNVKTKFQELLNSNRRLIKWLEASGLEKYLIGFYQNGFADINTVKDQMDKAQMKDIIESLGGSLSDYKLLVQAVDKLDETSALWLFHLLLHLIYFLFRLAWSIIKWGCKCNISHFCPFMSV